MLAARDEDLGASDVVAAISLLDSLGLHLSKVRTALGLSQAHGTCKQAWFRLDNNKAWVGAGCNEASNVVVVVVVMVVVVVVVEVVVVA
jgi:hypothetical protein